jgi:hypothetical protein
MAQIVILKRAHHFSLDNDIFDVHARTIGPMATLVYTALCRYANRKTGECWPSIGRLAHLLALARNTVKAALRTLEAAGLIAIKRRRDPAGDATSHLYTLLDPTPQAVEARLARRTAAALAPDEGRAGDDPPPVSSCPTGSSAIDPEPQNPRTTELNQAEAARAAKDKPATPPRPPALIVPSPTRPERPDDALRRLNLDPGTYARLQTQARSMLTAAGLKAYLIIKPHIEALIVRLCEEEQGRVGEGKASRVGTRSAEEGQAPSATTAVCEGVPV